MNVMISAEDLHPEDYQQGYNLRESLIAQGQDVALANQTAELLVMQFTEHRKMCHPCEETVFPDEG